MNWTTIDILLLIGGWGIALICLCLYLGQNKNLDKLFEMTRETFDRLDSYDRITNKAVALSTDILENLRNSNDLAFSFMDKVEEREELINSLRETNERLSCEINDLMSANHELSNQVKNFMSMEDDGK